MLKRRIEGDTYLSRFDTKKKADASGKARIYRAMKRKVRIIWHKNRYHVMVGPVR